MNFWRKCNHLVLGVIMRDRTSKLLWIKFQDASRTSILGRKVSRFIIQESVIVMSTEHYLYQCSMHNVFFFLEVYQHLGFLFFKSTHSEFFKVKKPFSLHITCSHSMKSLDVHVRTFIKTLLFYTQLICMVVFLIYICFAINK